MKKVGYILLFVLAQLLCESQNLQWVKTLEGENASTDYCRITLDKQANIYSVGIFAGTIDFDAGPNSFNLTAISPAYNNFICKMDAACNFIWAKRIYSDGTLWLSDPIFDNDGNTIISGNYMGTVHFDSSMGLDSITSGPATIKTFLLKLSPSGQAIWIKEFGDVWGQTQITGCAIDELNNIFLAGSFCNTVDFDPSVGVFNLSSQSTNSNQTIFILKLNLNGNLIWAKQIGGVIGNTMSATLKYDYEGKLYLMGSFENTIDIDPSAGVVNINPISSESSEFVCKIDTAGNLIWHRTIDVNTNSYIGSLGFKLDSKCNIIFTGYFTGTIDVNPSQDSVLFSSENLVHSSFIIKWDSLGNYKWAKQLKSDGTDSWNRISSSALDKSDNIYCAGGFIDTVDFNPGSDTLNVISDQIISNYLLVLDSDGNYKCMGSTVWEYTTYLMGYNYPSISVDDDYNLYYASSIVNTKDLDFSSNVYNVTVVGPGGDYHKLYIEKMSTCVDIPEKQTTANTIIPNIFTPNKDGINDAWKVELGNKELQTCIIYNRWGVVQKNIKSQNIDSLKTISWDGYTTSGVASSDGIYYYVIELKNTKGEIEKYRGYITLLR